MDRHDPSFQAWWASHPTYRPAIEKIAFRELAAGAERISMKGIFEELRYRGRKRGTFRHLNNTFTAPAADQVMFDNPSLRGKFEQRG